MGGARRRIDTLAVARGLPAGTHARTVLTGRTRGTNDVASAAVIDARHGIDALAIARGLSHWTHAHTILTCGRRRAGHIASAAVRWIVHRVDALHAARSAEARAEPADAGISRSAGFRTAPAILGIGLRIDTNAVARGRSAGTNALPIHAA